MDPKKEDFRKYLERSGVIDSLTKGLVSLYEEVDKPVDPVDFIKTYLGSSTAATEQLRIENSNLKKQVEELQAKVAELEKRLTN